MPGSTRTSESGEVEVLCGDGQYRLIDEAAISKRQAFEIGVLVERGRWVDRYGDGEHGVLLQAAEMREAGVPFDLRIRWKDGHCSLSIARQKACGHELYDAYCDDCIDEANA